MHPIQAFIQNPIKVSVGVLLVGLFGIVSLTRMPMQLTPEVQIPTLTVETRWPGAGPEEVEREIVQEQEEQLKSVEGITKMTSECMDSVGRITLEFLIGTNMEEAMLKVNTRLQQVPEYPEDADQPVISTSNISDRPIAWFILSARMPGQEAFAEFAERYPAAEYPEMHVEFERVRGARNDALALMRLRDAVERFPEMAELLPPSIDVPTFRKFAEDYIEARLERVAGVSNSEVIGGREPELQVIVDPQKLAARQLTILDVRAALRSQNTDVTGGDFWEGKRRYVVRTMGRFRQPEQVAAEILAVRDDQPVLVRDVAEVKLTYKKPDGFVRRFGTHCIAVNASRETGANVLDVMAGIQEAVKELNAGTLAARGLELTQVYDETEYIYSSVNLVNENIVLGSGLTIIVLMLFLHPGFRTLVFAPAIGTTAVLAVLVNPWFFAVTLALILLAGFWFARGALVVGLAIPISIVGTFLMMNLFGRSLNVISLAGLAFAVGMLVDNAVVVLENIFRHYQLGLKPFEAAERGTKEVWGAVVASTLTTLAVFVPVVFIQEEAGQLFRDIALAISAAVGLSLLVSVTVIPPATARLLRPGTRIASEEAPGTNRRRRRTPLGLLTAMIVGLNGWLLRGYVRRLVLVLLMVGGSIGLMYVLRPPVEYLPTGNRNLVFGTVLMPSGYNLEQMNQLGEVVESEFRPYLDIDPDSPEAKELPFPVIGDFFFVARGRQVFMGVRAHDPTRAGELVPLVMQMGARMPGSFAVAGQASLFGQFLQANRAIDIELTGPDLETLVSFGGQAAGQIGQMFPPQMAEGPDGQMVQVAPGAQIRPIPSLELASPEMRIEPKSMQAAEMGLRNADIGYIVNALVDGAYVTDYFLGADKIDLVIIGNGDYLKMRTQDLAVLPVATPNTTRPVRLDALADIRLAYGPEQVNHRERQRAITIQVSPPDNVPLEVAIARISEEVIGPLKADPRFNAGYNVTLSGTVDKLYSTWNALSVNLMLALLITYLLMAALFESWAYPFVIILSVAWGAVGGIVGLRGLNVLLAYTGQQLQTLDVLTMLGFVILVGTVVNNAILIVHQALNHIRDDAMRPREALLESIRTRIRPIFMTTGTTVLGLSPLVFFPGAGSELYRGLGAVVLGGLLVSTLFTLFLVPMLFSLMMDTGAFLGRVKSRWFPAPAEGPAPETAAAPPARAARGTPAEGRSSNGARHAQDKVAPASENAAEESTAEESDSEPLEVESEAEPVETSVRASQGDAPK